MRATTGAHPATQRSTLHPLQPREPRSRHRQWRQCNTTLNHRLAPAPHRPHPGSHGMAHDPTTPSSTCPHHGKLINTRAASFYGPVWFRVQHGMPRIPRTRATFGPNRPTLFDAGRSVENIKQHSVGGAPTLADSVQLWPTLCRVWRSSTPATKAEFGREVRAMLAQQRRMLGPVRHNSAPPPPTSHRDNTPCRFPPPARAGMQHDSLHPGDCLQASLSNGDRRT